jgi:hypothetical protein
MERSHEGYAIRSVNNPERLVTRLNRGATFFNISLHQRWNWRNLSLVKCFAKVLQPLNSTLEEGRLLHPAVPNW